MDKPQTWYLQHNPEVPRGVILVGDMRRLDLFAENLKNPRFSVGSHGMTLLTGQYKGIPLGVLAHGMGAPAAAVAIEELHTLGAEVVIRAGTTMTIACPLGSLVLAEGGVRLEGTSIAYLPIEFPAIPDYQLLTAFASGLSSRGVPYRVGLIASMDGLHPNRLREGKLDVMLLRKAGVVGLDMETAAVYAVCRYLQLKAVSLCLATVKFDSFEVLGEKERRALEKLLVEATLEGVREFFEKYPAIG